jgi:hypothetical protein
VSTTASTGMRSTRHGGDTGEEEVGCAGPARSPCRRRKTSFCGLGGTGIRKALEAYFTALIELAWGKQRIIEVYLNVSEWGPGIYGAEAAAQYHFHKSARALTADEASRLAAILPDPLQWLASPPDRHVVGRAAFIREQMPDLPLGTPACRNLAARNFFAPFMSAVAWRSPHGVPNGD